jgi:hypothetical protein
MSEVIRYSETCKVKPVGSSGKEVEAVVHDFKIRQHLTVILNKSVKLHLRWNGKVYEGAMAGLDFISNGPRVVKFATSIRG